MARRRTNTEERLFSIGEAAKFFDKDTQWLRWRERDGKFTRIDGTSIAVDRKSSNKLGGGDRRYTLSDIREIAHSLRRHELLDNDELKRVLARVDAFEIPIAS